MRNAKIGIINVKFLLINKWVLPTQISIKSFKVKSDQWRSIKSALTAVMLCPCSVCVDGTGGRRTWEICEALIKSVLIFLASDLCE